MSEPREDALAALEQWVPWNPKRPSGNGWVVAENGCHLWRGHTNRNGYGYAYDSVAKKQRVVHRIRYEREVGPIPPGMFLDHFACDNKLCCNPTHVRPVTSRENNLRANGTAAVHAARTHCRNGHPLFGPDAHLQSTGSRGHRRCGPCHNAALRRRRNAKAGK